ncbi:hypothetical protein AAF712_011556 [Marasmius tenuissimus]|uniref:Uncharacterized protein n=1 Tax=Marasmius tenuissimus TaxID=585030 RepID=A0ABR2ZLN7_9AGAR|nr:hypothetical protein PM082_011592 [Marasmius tenuissimus]KAJ8092547.1 hypothetical protein PM082_023801 [Marasmius tenuissimus]KAJ8095591.1 hypothetical protein PM082_022997 [Marasmius tenuissimus]
MLAHIDDYHIKEVFEDHTTHRVVYINAGDRSSSPPFTPDHNTSRNRNCPSLIILHTFDGTVPFDASQLEVLISKDP